MPKINIPMGLNSGEVDLTDESKYLSTLIYKPDRTTTGQGKYTSSTSNITYDTDDYPDDVDIYNCGEVGLIHLWWKLYGGENGFIELAEDANKYIRPSNETTQTVEPVKINADKLGGNLPSFYLNYNNLINKPNLVDYAYITNYTLLSSEWEPVDNLYRQEITLDNFNLLPSSQVDFDADFDIINSLNSPIRPFNDNGTLYAKTEIAPQNDISIQLTIRKITNVDQGGEQPEYYTKEQTDILLDEKAEKIYGESFGYNITLSGSIEGGLKGVTLYGVSIIIGDDITSALEQDGENTPVWDCIYYKSEDNSIAHHIVELSNAPILRGVYVGSDYTCDITYVDDFGDAIISDVYNTTTGVVTRNIRTLNINGTEDWELYPDIQNVFRLHLPYKSLDGSTGCVSLNNQYEDIKFDVSTLANYDYAAFVDASGEYFCIKDSDYTTVSDFKTFLSGINTELNYAVFESYIEQAEKITTFECGNGYCQCIILNTTCPVHQRINYTQGMLSNLVSLKGYRVPSAYTPISEDDNVQIAIGKLEKKIGEAVSGETVYLDGYVKPTQSSDITEADTINEGIGKLDYDLSKLKGDMLQFDKYVYVTSTGNDTTGNGSVSNPYATVQAALDNIPKNLNGHTAYISVGVGTFDKFVVEDFFGGYVYVYGVQDTGSIDTITLQTTITDISGNNNVITVNNCRLLINYLEIAGSDTSKYGIYSNNSNIKILNTQVNMKKETSCGIYAILNSTLDISNTKIYNSTTNLMDYALNIAYNSEATTISSFIGTTENQCKYAYCSTNNSKISDCGYNVLRCVNIYTENNGGTVSNVNKITNVTLLSASWVGNSAPYTYTISINGVTAMSNQQILPTIDITLDQLTALQNANIQDGGQSSNSIILKAYGEKPTIDLPIRIIKQ